MVYVGTLSLYSVLATVFLVFCIFFTSSLATSTDLHRDDGIGTLN